MLLPLPYVRHNADHNVAIYVFGVDHMGRTFGGAAKPADVLRALADAAATCGHRLEHLHTVRQVHGANILAVPDDMLRLDVPHQADALITQSDNQAIAVTVADCAPLVLTTKNTLCVVHSGWRGTANRITERAIDAIHQIDASGQISAWLGPMACGSCYEVGDDVAALFPHSVNVGRNNRWYYDNRQELMRRLGTYDVHIHSQDERCTITDRTLHSHRRDGLQAGRNLIVAIRTR
jgi:polyphenol oxidase